MNRHPVWTLLIASLVCKILLAWITPVFGDEAYYYIWSLHPQLSYFDHPPMVSWFIYLGHLLLPAGNPVSLRILFILAGFAASVLWVRILQEAGAGEKIILGFLALLFLNPLLGPGSIVATPDVPLVLFWTISYYCFLRIESGGRLTWYSLLGAALGLGFCSKYHIVLFVLSGLLYLGFSGGWRRLHPAGVILTILSGALFCTPVILWNARNEWSSFLFQINHGFGDDGFSWSWPANYVLTQILLLSPVVFWALCRRPGNLAHKTFSLSQLVFFFSSSLRSVVEANWPLTAHLHATANFAATATRKAFRFTLVYWLTIYLLIGVFFASPYSARVRQNLVNSAQLEELLPLTEKYTPLYGPSYQVASLLSWKTQSKIPKLRELSRHDFYDSLPESLPSAPVFYALKKDYSTWPPRYDRYRKTRLQVFDKTGLELYELRYE